MQFLWERVLEHSLNDVEEIPVMKARDRKCGESGSAVLLGRRDFNGDGGDLEVSTVIAAHRPNLIFEVDHKAIGCLVFMRCMVHVDGVNLERLFIRISPGSKG